MTDTERSVIQRSLEAANLNSEKQQRRSLAALAIKSGVFLLAVAIIMFGYGKIIALEAAAPTVDQQKARECRETRRALFLGGISGWVNTLDDLEEHKSSMKPAEYDKGRLKAYRTLRPIVAQVANMACPNLNGR